MSYIYRTVSGEKQGINGIVTDALSSPREDANLEILVSAGFLYREDTDCSYIKATENIGTPKVVKLDGTVAKVASTNCVGISIASGNNGTMVPYNYDGKAVAKASEVDIVEDDLLVASADGSVITYKTGDAVLMSSVQSAATGDFDNSVWNTSGEVINIRTLVDDATARAVVVTCHFINELDVYDTENITTDTEDSSVVVSGIKLCKRLLGLSVGASISNVHLVLENETANACIDLTTPATGSVFGAVLTDDSDAALGHVLKIDIVGDAGAATPSTLTAGVNAVSEVHTITVDATGGDFTITWNGQTTTALAYDISNTDMQAALVALSNIAPGDVVVTGGVGAGGGGTPYTLTWLDTLGNVAIPTTTPGALTGGAGTAIVAQGTQGSIATLEVQKIIVNASGGTFTITWSGQTTSALAYNISATAMQTALVALSNIAPGDVVVTGGPGSGDGSTPYILTWLATLGNVAQPTTNAGSLTGDGIYGNLLVVGTDSADVAQTEIVNFTGQATKYTAKAYKLCTALYVGDDDSNTATYSLKVEGNSVEQIIGKASYGAISAKGTGLIQLGVGLS